jgi:hypothetical protein
VIGAVGDCQFDNLNYYFTVGYGTESTFYVYGNLKSGKAEATSSGVLTLNNPSVIPKTLMAMDIIGTYKNEFISGFYSAPFLLPHPKNLFEFYSPDKMKYEE